MKKSILAFLISAAATTFACEDVVCAGCSCTDPVKNSYSYVDIGVGPLPIPFPSFGIGYQTQNGHHGTDVSLQVTTIVVVTQVKANAIYHYFFNPCLTSQFYTGGGIGISQVFCNGSATCISPELVFGKQYINEAGDRRFGEVQISFPTVAVTHAGKPLYMPLVLFKYGIGF